MTIWGVWGVRFDFGVGRYGENPHDRKVMGVQGAAAPCVSLFF